METCYLCGTTDGLTDSHIPPKGFFLPGKLDFVTVRACRTCCNQQADDDDAMRAWLAYSAFYPPTEMRSCKPEGGGSTFAPRPELREHLQGMFRADDGHVIGDAFGIPRPRVNAWLTRIVAGLRQHYYPEAFVEPGELEVAMFLHSTDPWWEQQRRQIRPARLFDRRGEGIFDVWYSEATKGPRGIWNLRFFGAVSVLVFEYWPSRYTHLWLSRPKRLNQSNESGFSGGATSRSSSIYLHKFVS